MLAAYPDNLGIPSDLEREFGKMFYSANFRDKVGFGRYQLAVGDNLEFQDNTINGWTFLVPSFEQVTS